MGQRDCVAFDKDLCKLKIGRHDDDVGKGACLQAAALVFAEVVGRVGRDQVAEYAARKGWTLAQAERWLSPNLGYDPE